MESVALGIDQAVFRDRIIVFAHTIFDVYLVWEVHHTIPFSPVSNKKILPVSFVLFSNFRISSWTKDTIIHIFGYLFVGLTMKFITRNSKIDELIFRG